MKKIIPLILIQGYLMAANLLHVTIDGVDVPVVFEESSALPLSTVEFIFKNSGNLASSKNGLVTMSSSLLNEGDIKLGSIEFAKELENRAIDLSVHNGRETLVFTIESLKEQFDFALDKLISVVKSPNYKDEVFKKIVKKRLAILEKKQDDFDYIAANGLRSILFKGTPLEEPSLGTKESIKALKLDDLKEFINSHIKLDNLIVVAGGNFTNDEIKSIVKKFASNLTRGKVEEIGKYIANSSKETKSIKKDTKQAYIYFGAPYTMDVNDTKKVIGKVASHILGSSGFGSRLMEEVRVKRGLAYSAYSRFVVNRSSSYFSGYLQTKLEKQTEAIGVVKEVVENFVKNGITNDELESAKKFFLGSEPLRVERLSQRVGRGFSEYYSGLGLGFSQKELDIIENLKLDEVNSFIKEHKEILDMSLFIVTNR